MDFEKYDLLTPYELIILDNHNQIQLQDTIQLLQTAMWYNTISKSKKRFTPMYPEKAQGAQKARTQTISEQDRQSELDALRQSFGLVV